MPINQASSLITYNLGCFSTQLQQSADTWRHVTMYGGR